MCGHVCLSHLMGLFRVSVPLFPTATAGRCGRWLVAAKANTPRAFWFICTLYMPQWLPSPWLT